MKTVDKKAEQYAESLISDKSKADYTYFDKDAIIEAFKTGYNAAIKHLHEDGGYPLDMNGNIPSYEQALKDVKLFNEWLRKNR